MLPVVDSCAAHGFPGFSLLQLDPETNYTRLRFDLFDKKEALFKTGSHFPVSPLRTVPSSGSLHGSPLLLLSAASHGDAPVFTHPPFGLQLYPELICSSEKSD